MAWPKGLDARTARLLLASSDSASARLGGSIDATSPATVSLSHAVGEASVHNAIQFDIPELPHVLHHDKQGSSPCMVQHIADANEFNSQGSAVWAIKRAKHTHVSHQLPVELPVVASHNSSQFSGNTHVSVSSNGVHNMRLIRFLLATHTVAMHSSTC